MALIAIISLLLGVFGGQMLFSAEIISAFDSVGDVALFLMMLSIGISVGGNKQVFRQIREYRFKILMVPLGVIAASVLAGFVCAPLAGMAFKESVPVTASMGWYSLSGVLLASLAGADVGAIAFLSSMIRELLAFLCIPILTKRLNVYAAVAAAGATSMDTALPMLVKYTGPEFAVMAVFNGVAVSSAVPILIRLFYQIL